MKYIVALTVHVTIEAPNRAVADTEAWAKRLELLKQAKDVMSTQVIREDSR